MLIEGKSNVFEEHTGFTVTHGPMGILADDVTTIGKVAPRRETSYSGLVLLNTKSFFQAATWRVVGLCF